MRNNFINRRGNAAVTALSLMALLGFGALAVDVAYVRVVNAQMQVAVEAGVLAGAGYLDGTEQGMTAAATQAAWYANQNPVLGGLTIAPEAVEFGTWDEDGGFVTSADPSEVNSMRMDLHHDSISSLLAGVAFGQHTLSTRVGAMAVRQVGGPAAEVDCFLPIALPDCAFHPEAGVNPDPIKIGPGNGDRMGWTHPDGANMSNVRSYFREVDGSCASSVAIGDPLPVMNGVGSANTDLIKALNGEAALLPTEWPVDVFPAGPPLRGGDFAFLPPGGGGNGNGGGGGGGGGAADTSGVDYASWGNVIAGPIAILDMGTCDANGKPSEMWNGQHPVVGFTWGIIYDQNTHNGNDAATWVQLDFLNEHELGTRPDPDAIGNVISKDLPPVLVAY